MEVTKTKKNGAVVSGLKQGLKSKEANASIGSWGKQVKENTCYRLIVRTTGDTREDFDIVMAGAWGRNLDNDAFGSSFCLYKPGEYEYNEETGRTEDKTQMVAIAQMARVLHAAKCEMEIREAEEKAEREAKRLGKEINPVTQAETTRNIKMKYFGENNDGKRIYADENPVVGKKDAPLVTEVWAIPLDANGAPDFENSFVSTFDISNRKSIQMSGVVKHPENYDPALGYIEFGYDYLGKTKQEAGQNAAITGITTDNYLCKKFPELWEANRYKLDRLSNDPEIILERNGKYRFACSTEFAAAAFDKYVSKIALALDCLDFASDDVKKCAKSLLSLNAVKDAKFIAEKLQAIVDEEGAEADENVDTEEMSADAIKVAGAKKLSDVADVDIDSVRDESGLDEV